ncbi:MAG: UvrB/UvrC motif-containing protein [Candidatus Omnitrophica bacterium]|nr:UvrB/UvrC motif-containing protein [Candidatus Omnitrophota bacterium]MDD4013265.1 UvrB/UvrC motif-containing protein [Candidatus Omnitrophota bacterium]
MKCDLCGKNDATVHLTEVVNDKVTKLHLCERCAKDKSEEMHSHFGLSDLLSGLMDFGPAIENSAEAIPLVKCAGCGMTYQDFQKTGRLGCGKCYETFEKNLGELLRKIHGADRHIGKMPFKGESVLKDQEDLKRLKNDLAKLIREEEFEKAVLLRDRIKELETKLEVKPE